MIRVIKSKNNKRIKKNNELEIELIQIYAKIKYNKTKIDINNLNELNRFDISILLNLMINNYNKKQEEKPEKY